MQKDMLKIKMEEAISGARTWGMVSRVTIKGVNVTKECQVEQFGVRRNR